MRGIRLGRIGGVTVRAELSWFVVVALVALSMIARVDAIYDTAPATSVLLGVGAAALFFVSLLLHELAHAAMSIRLGLVVEDITLFLFGGATRTRADQRSAREEFLVTVVGPLTSLALAGLFGLLVALIGSPEQALMGMVGYLAWVNLALALFNLAPAYPLDGGRLLRAAIWHVTGDRERATTIAARVGELAAWALIAYGVVSFAGGGTGGLWLALIGWFLLQSARGEHLRQAFRHELTAVSAEEVMALRPLVLDADDSVEDALEDLDRRRAGPAVPVVDPSGGYLGVVTRDELVEIDPDRRPMVAVGDLVDQIPDGVAVDAHAAMTEVFEHLDGPDAQVFIVAGPHRTVVGVVSPRELLDWIERREQHRRSQP